ncbi:hypothetical protein K402DRAFT_148243 [Aulographum hederae CBS 113979]|uniref:Uncharacterized protein n=1 Tax=Aulographum hederae CBS 113979 TaxID=1176131 RepID=A0A6G1GU57_9PEZI|nr:hypothetical protein K402DRAFT_148243 [Aulographum hederae CBS 113979]
MLAHTLTLILTLALGLAQADPAPKPIANPAPLPEANPAALPEPQTNVYEPFSGAIYVYGGDGQGFSSASPAQCPGNAPQNCGNINVWNWCCPTGDTCHMLSNSLVGCCPSGASCGGQINAAQITTVTVYAQQNPTTVYQQPTTVYAGGGGGVYVAPTTEVVSQQGGGGNVYNGYCSTLVADGPGLPTERAGECGTILVVQGRGARVGFERMAVLGTLVAAVVGGVGVWGGRVLRV